ncbi:RNA polymerase sigma-70 factor, ECF subfamily [Hathewaya proteolytica DSM 3090]|uniref:RNA polymerase sigma-70 factor, ECF subfamily n=1 Tax=Hathewaya proteolytica DSM 3090 TaxID=1121331 RepID=A0A1M6LQU3_9CLOT|nr:sigma-70 family RNA polymerase sigma factor [Hathewaya proteolytica]SHJ73442.1 RNA polymerase sigma-70 factor, ECF subfamily [Hathewaya proteolytica DSM 3090]
MAEFGKEFEKIYIRYFNDVFLFLKKLSKDEGIAEEITSETFFKAMRSIDNFRGEADIRVWLCQIAKNCCFSYLKKQQRIVDIDDLDVIDFPEHKDNIEEQILNQYDAIEIHTLLHNLAEPYKEIFMLRVFGELSFKQIADIFQKTENWACVTYHRARNKILKQMEDHDEQ